MENSRALLKNFSAYQSITQQFLENCEKLEVDPALAFHALGQSLLGLKVQVNMFSVPVVQPQSPKVEAEAKPILPQLSKVQAAEALKLARIEKAKKFPGASEKDVALTTEEANKARHWMRVKLGKEQSQLAAYKQRVVPVPEPKKEISPDAEGSKKSSKTSKTANNAILDVQQNILDVQKKPTKASGSKVSGSKKTAYTRIREERKRCIHQSPSSQTDPKGIHLVAYSNHYLVLARQWELYRSRFDDAANRQSPLRGLINPAEDPIGSFLANLIKEARLEPHSGAPGVFILQDLTSGYSYWNKDKPNEACPRALKEPLPKEILDLFPKPADKQEEEESGSEEDEGESN